jgi:hypothetical protein
MSLFLTSSRTWAPGAGGGGGGGAFALRAGNSLRLGPAGRLFARGGSAASSTGVASAAQPSPGGGGSGGSIVLQSARLTEISGLIDVRGGAGGTFNRSSSVLAAPNGGNVVIAGGDGSSGFVRLEVPGTPATSLLAGMQPAPTSDNVGTLQETDELVACRSKFYSTGLIFGPEFARYEIYATVDGVPQVFSDDPAVSTVPAGPGAPVRALFQAAQLDLVTLQPIEFSPWRTGVRTSSTQEGINTDARNGFRFQLLIDRTLGTTITIDRVVVVYRV